MAWYILQTKPLYEAKVLAGVSKHKETGRLNEIREIFAPENTVTEYKDGKKKERKVKMYSTYIYVEMDYSDEVFHTLKGISGVTGFLGPKGRPSVVPVAEVERVKKLMSGETPKPKVSFEMDTEVRITTGSFAEFIGTVKGIDYEKNKITVEVKIFGRETKVEMPLGEVEAVKS